ncbi:hypothetical protein [Agarivorans sp. Alg241-V36]|uniref:hypothetical protein n=1 Tax=Agarivorans sp. Alg241-V36 TaxID=2305992 RepID=UPI0013D5E113|nr:hypothetical protein [Agarivorans sp. Alg241-V36]
MEELKGFLVEEVEGSVDVTLSSSEQKINLPGLVVENGFNVPPIGTLWLTSNDSPYEETLYISLVDSESLVTERVELYKAYTPGVLKDVVSKGNYIEFEFWQGQTHQVTIEKEKKLRFSRFLPQAGCHYSSKLAPSYLTISK